MDRRRFLRGLAAAATCPVCASLASAAQAEGGKPHWTYEGHEGPEHWGNLDPSYGACSIGHEQSPVNLTQATPAMVGDLDVRWRPVPLDVINNGHTIQCNTPGGGSLVVDGKEYELKQFHFHHPSEHVVNGMAHAMEVHFVHQSADKSLAVIGVFFQAGAANSTLEPIWANIPTEAGGHTSNSTMISLASFLPTREVTWRYAGSLTTPPCSEIVSWIVYQDPIEASVEQIKAFGTLFPMNARPVQGMNRRKLLMDFF
jgi:carbonic anhydrase